MEETKMNKKEQEIVFSKSIKAGKRIYYLDVKRSRNDDLFIAITESKKKIQGDDENPLISFEKHKIFLYKEDFTKFTTALTEVIDYIQENKPAEEGDENEHQLSPDDSNAEESQSETTNTKRYDFDIDFGI